MAEQTLKYQAATESRDEALKPLLEQQRDGLKTLRLSIGNGASEGEVQRSLDRLKELLGSIRDVEARYETALATFLTPIHRARLAAAQAAAPKKTASGDDDREYNQVPGDEEEKE